MAELDLSPSRFHRILIERTRQTLGYRGGNVQAWQERLRGRLRELLGMAVVEAAPRCPLNVRSLWKRQIDLGTIEKIVFRAQEGVDVPAYVCLPASARPPYTFFLCLQGHSTGMHNSIAVAAADEVTPISVPGDRDFGLACMRRGVAALCVEQRSFGQRVEKHLTQGIDYLCHQAGMHALMLGTTLLAERVWDLDRAIDYLESRGDADLSRLGCMGNSGGGTTTIFATALLPRIRAAMPSCCFSTFAASILGTFHCLCNYVPHLYGTADMGDLVGLAAPRPLVIVSGIEDGIFPIGPARAEFARTAEVYRAAGAADRCRLVEGPQGHRFYADLAWPVMLKLMER